jgi:hypothetical protein
MGNAHERSECCPSFSVSTPLFLPLKDDAAEAAINDSFLAAGAANQVAAKTMERHL